jgi:hypothetical protein
MSVPFTLACVMQRGRLVLSDLYDVERPRTLELVERVELEADESVPKLGCRLVLETSAGRWEQQVHDVEAELAVTWESVDELAAPLWDEGAWPASRYGQAKRWVAALTAAPHLAGLARIFDRAER